MHLEPLFFVFLAVALGAGCTPRSGTNDTGGDLSVDEFSSENLESTSMGLSWNSAEPTLARLRYGVENVKENTVYSTLEPAQEHEVRLHFLRPGTEYRYRVELLEQGELVGSKAGRFLTSAVPDELPELEVTVNELEEPKLILATVMGDVMAPVVISQEGYYAWWHIEQEEGLAVPRARLANDGQSIYYSAYDKGESESPEAQYHLRRVWLADGAEEAFDIRLHHHDFDVLPDDSIGWIMGDMRRIDGENYRGDAIVETDVDGVQTTIWSSWDHITFDMVSDCNDSRSNIWTHANALYYEVATGLYYLSLRETDSIVAVDRASGETLWILGGCDSTFDFGDSLPFDGQHQFQYLDRGILVYDNQPKLTSSRMVEYSMDMANHSVEEVWSYDADGAYFTSVLGDVQRLKSGNTQVTWSTSATMEEVDSSGQLLWQAVFGFGTVLGYSTVLE